MKKIIFLCLLYFILSSCSNCDPTDTDPVLANQSKAITRYDDCNFGIYKGVVINNSGIIEVNINNDLTIAANLILDGTHYTFTTNEKATLNKEIIGLTFNSKVGSFDFNVKENGQNPNITNILIAEHPNCRMLVVKETASKQIECYEGRYTGNDAGVFNFILTTNGPISGFVASKNNLEPMKINGFRKEDSLISGTFNDATFEGILQENNSNGTWKNEKDQAGIWVAKRKL
jgi:hypothetical protein